MNQGMGGEGIANQGQGAGEPTQFFADHGKAAPAESQPSGTFRNGHGRPPLLDGMVPEHPVEAAGLVEQ
ncbi:hypothetical protein D3C80_2121860 [compost metagenome]